MNTWISTEHTPPSGVSVLLKLKSGAVHEGHYIKHGNKYVKNVNRFRIYKYKKTFAPEDIIGWQDMPI